MPASHAWIKPLLSSVQAKAFPASASGKKSVAGLEIIFAPQAPEQLDQIVRFIGQDDPRAAIRFGDYWVDRAESLANFPELGTPYRKRATGDLDDY
jgi:ParE toxin of type II toxin-antitoxin system, parDE